MLNFCCDAVMTEEEFKMVFKDRVIDKDDYFFIPKFLCFQYPGGLNSEKKFMVSVKNELAKYGLSTVVVELFGKDFLSINNPLVIDYQSIQRKSRRKSRRISRRIRTRKRIDSVVKKNSCVVVSAGISPTNDIFKYFCDGYQKTFNKQYIATFAKDKAILKDLSRIKTRDELLDLIDRFFASTDSFILRSGYTVGVFKAVINKLQLNMPSNITDAQIHNLKSAKEFERRMADEQKRV